MNPWGARPHQHRLVGPAGTTTVHTICEEGEHMGQVTHSWVVNENGDQADGWCSCGRSQSGDKDAVSRAANNH